MQQQQRAGEQLYAAGGGLVDRQLRGLQNLRDTQLSLGQTEQALETDARVRQMQSTAQVLPELRAMGLREEQRPVESIREAMSVGELERSLELARAQAAQNDLLRMQALMQYFINPGGSIAFGQGPTATESQTRNTGGGFGLFK